ncbi:hypothetical protein TWF506_004656 [Arthrobotrys conoides]|uniref:F-box domain-containing protein n=1 Tax=Arthrobotrys conoides TaxID=74498 RepID=A0AAN8RI15_9PEZI
MSSSSSSSSHTSDSEDVDQTHTADTSIIPAVSLVASIANAAAAPTHSLLGQMPNEVLENILERVGRASIGAFGLAAKWCQAHSDEMYFRNIDLTPVSLIYLTMNPQHIPKIREIKIDCRMVGVLNINTINFIASIPNLRTISLHSVSSRSHCRVLHYMLKFIPTIPTLRRLEISVGHNLTPQGVPRVVGHNDPDWDNLNMNDHPNLKEISYDFGPMAASITRIDMLFYNTFAVQKKHVKVLEIKSIQMRRHTQLFPEGLKHYVMRCAEEEVNPNGVWNANSAIIQNAFQDCYVDLLLTESVEVLRFYSDMRKSVPTEREREISIQEVCKVFPNLKELDFVTRDSWKTNFRQTTAPEKLTKLKSFTHPGTTRTSTTSNSPAGYITESTYQSTGPIAVAPRSVMDHLTRHWFPNVDLYGWYSRDSTSTLNAGLHRVRITQLRSLWWVLHRGWVGLIQTAAVYWPGLTYNRHWWGPAVTTLLI